MVLNASLAGDTAGNGIVNTLDITTVERVIVHLDTVSVGADADMDSSVDVTDVIKVEGIIAVLE